MATERELGKKAKVDEKWTRHMYKRVPLGFKPEEMDFVVFLSERQNRELESYEFEDCERKKYVSENVCEYCLHYGHRCDPNVYPPTLFTRCLKLQGVYPDYKKKIVHIAQQIFWICKLVLFANLLDLQTKQVCF